MDGPSGSGKSTLARRLAAGLKCPLIHMDDLYPGWDGLEDAVPRLLEWVVEPLAAGRPARYRRFDWPSGQYAEWHDVPATDALIIEGVASGSTAAAAYLSMLVWVEAGQDERFRRGIERDGEAYRPHWQRWAVQEERHFEAEGTRERADVVVDGELDSLEHEAERVRVLRWPGEPSIVLRTVDPAGPDLPAWREAAIWVFKDNSPNREAKAEFRRPDYDGQRLTAAYDGDTVVGTFRSWDTGLTVPGGRTVPADAISTVTVSPTHRRRGLLTRMMRADLEAAVERGVPVAILIASEATIYGRFGFAPATHSATWTVDRGRAAVRPEAPSEGHVRVVSTEEFAQAAARVYARSRRPGAMDVTNRWWQVTAGAIFPPGVPPTPAVNLVHRDGSGEQDGLLRYHSEDRWEDRICRTVVHVDVLDAATPAAYADLWRFLLSLDMVERIRLEERSVDDVLPHLLVDPRAARITSVCDFLWTRVLDVPAVLEARCYPGPLEVTIQVDDPFGWAEGRWRLTVDGGGGRDSGVRCVPVPDAECDVRLDVRALSGLWLGGGDAEAQHRSGLVTASRREALAALAHALHTPTAPWAWMWF